VSSRRKTPPKKQVGGGHAEMAALEKARQTPFSPPSVPESASGRLIVGGLPHKTRSTLAVRPLSNRHGWHNPQLGAVAMSENEPEVRKEDQLLDEAARIREMPAPDLPYQPRDPKTYRPGIGLIGCGDITTHHLTAYRDAGYSVVALCDVVEDCARQRQKEYYPEAKVYTDYGKVLRSDDVEVVDITTHPPERPPIIEAAIAAGKHVLSQKPFVLDLDVGRRLVELADKKGVRLAVNQNGRWAPHFSYALRAIEAGLLGEPIGAHLSVHWDHSWVEGTKFEEIKHLILYDFAIHWFDMVTAFFGGKRAERVYASTARAAKQTIAPNMLGQALIEYDGGQATLAFDAVIRHGQQDRSYVGGTEGSVSSVGPNYRTQTLTLSTADGTATPSLSGSWFPDGFHGTMGELLCAVEEDREPTISAANNLDSLALCFAAIDSAERHEPVVPGTVRCLPE
jgi:predicted dehydrogenase